MFYKALKIKTWLRYQPVVKKLKEYMELRNLSEDEQKNTIGKFFVMVSQEKVPEPNICIQDLEFQIDRELAKQTAKKIREKSTMKNQGGTSVFYSD
ncbi:MAG TPA: hypothetical protein V6C58_03190 [Allocoleopsis sp.]